MLYIKPPNGRPDSPICYLLAVDVSVGDTNNVLSSNQCGADHWTVNMNGSCVPRCRFGADRRVSLVIIGGHC